MPQPLQYDFVKQIITVPIQDTSLDLQYLINQTRDMEDNAAPGMGYGQILEAFGKQDLGGGVQVGITVVLLENWKVKFADRPGLDTVSVRVSGGNLVGDAGHNPIEPSLYTQVTLANSSSATIATSASDTNLLYLIESLRGSATTHKGMGNIFYWDPYSGSDTKNGTSPTEAVKTFAAAQTLASSGNADIIYCLAKDPSGITTTTETLNITKNGLKIRGPGHIFQLIPTSTVNDTVVINSNSVEFSGFYIKTAATGTANGISITGDRNFIKDCWITNVRGQGIDITNSAFSKITECAIEHCDVDGIKINDNVTQLNISKNIIFSNTAGVLLAGTGISDNLIENNIIYKHTGYGVDIGSGVTRTNIRGGNTFTKNTLGNTSDLGVDTYIETQAGGASASEVADAVWDEVLSSHVTAGSAGKNLKDAKIKATLASLK